MAFKVAYFKSKNQFFIVLSALYAEAFSEFYRAHLRQVPVAMGVWGEALSRLAIFLS